MATNLEFIKSVSGSSVSTLSLTNCFSAEYDVYLMSISKADFGGNAYTQIRYIDNGGSVISANEYDFAVLDMYANSSFAELKGTSQSSIPNFALAQSGADDFGGITALIYNPFDSSSFTFSTIQSSSFSSAGRGSKHIGVHKSAEQLSGLQINRSDGATMDNLTINLYGVK